MPRYNLHVLHFQGEAELKSHGGTKIAVCEDGAIEKKQQDCLEGKHG
jgi:hypothetical protein